MPFASDYLFLLLLLLSRLVRVDGSFRKPHRKIERERVGCFEFRLKTGAPQVLSVDDVGPGEIEMFRAGSSSRV